MTDWYPPGATECKEIASSMIGSLEGTQGLAGRALQRASIVEPVHSIGIGLFH